MIVLDTHMWYWWVGQSDRLTPLYRELIDEHRDEGLGVSVISCWEVAKKKMLSENSNSTVRSTSGCRWHCKLMACGFFR